jgi:hypothetical protein
MPVFGATLENFEEISVQIQSLEMLQVSESRVKLFLLFHSRFTG